MTKIKFTTKNTKYNNQNNLIYDFKRICRGCYKIKLSNNVEVDGKFSRFFSNFNPIGVLCAVSEKAYKCYFNVEMRNMETNEKYYQKILVWIPKIFIEILK